MLPDRLGSRLVQSSESRLAQLPVLPCAGVLPIPWSAAEVFDRCDGRDGSSPEEEADARAAAAARRTLDSWVSAASRARSAPDNSGVCAMAGVMRSALVLACDVSTVLSSSCCCRVGTDLFPNAGFKRGRSAQVSPVAVAVNDPTHVRRAVIAAEGGTVPRGARRERTKRGGIQACKRRIPVAQRV